MVAFHPVRHALLERRTNARGEHAPARQRTVGGDVEHADQRLHRIVDVEELLIRREAEAVRLIEQQALDEQLRGAATGRDAVDTLKAELPRTLDAIARHAAI